MKKILFVVLTIMSLSSLFAENVDYDREYKRVTHDYDLLDSTQIDIEFGLEWYSTIIVYDNLGIAVVMDYKGRDLFFYVYKKPSSAYELLRPIDSIARAMVYTEAPGATSVFFVERAKI